MINGGHGIKNPLLQNNVLTQLVNAHQLGEYGSFDSLRYIHYQLHGSCSAEADYVLGCVRVSVCLHVINFPKHGISETNLWIFAIAQSVAYITILHHTVRYLFITFYIIFNLLMLC